jgi:hypothetical protein
MTLPAKLGTTPQNLCYTIQRAAKKQAGMTLTSRAWNHYDPDRSPWWLIPSTEWPAYKFGKLTFRWDEDESSVILAGLQVERGVQPTMAGVFQSSKGKRFIMRDDWEWFRLLKRIQDGEFAETLQQAAQSIKSEVYLRLAMELANDPNSFDPEAPAVPRTTRTFLWEPAEQSLRLILSKDSGQLAPGVAKARTLQAVAQEIAAAENTAWLWVNFLVIVRLEPTNPPEVEKAPDIWANFLSCFLESMRGT